MDFKSKVTEIALQAGGSHYPGVNRSQLDAYTRLVIDECLAAADAARHNHILTTYDRDLHASSVDKIKKSIKERFGL